MMKRRGLAALALAGAMVGSAGGRQAPAAQASTPIDPVDLVLASFAERPLVALAEAHGLQEEHDLIARLLRDPRFADATSTIVIEWANALYQPTIDRYLAGEEVPLPELRKAWRNTGFSPFAPWDAPVYERFFTVAREVNLSRPPARRMRVVAADPPVDWSQSRRRPAALTLKGTWLGETTTDPVMETSVERGFSDGTVARAKVNPYLGLKLQDLADAYLCLGDMDSLTASVPSPDMFADDPDYVRELQRRYGIVNKGGALPDSFFTRPRSRKFYRGGD